MIEKVMTLIEKNFTRIKNNNSYFDDIGILVTNERLNDSELRGLDKDKILVVVEFLAGTITAGQTLQPITLSVLTEHHNIEKAQSLLFTFAEIYNTKDDGDIKQFYTTPVMVNAWNEIYDGYRGLYAMSGTLLISENSNPLKDVKYYVDNQYEKVEVLESQVSYGIQVNPYAYIDQESANTYAHATQGTLTVSLTLYLTDTTLLNDALEIALNDGLMDKKFRLQFIYKDTYSGDFQLVDLTQINRMNELPLITLTFTRTK